ncbi:hypothetical protein C0Q61_31160 [Streptomyces albidoflavus]|nr:hypothetical protein C0Q61_31160 [Streptomyces albidoflavus]
MMAVERVAVDLATDGRVRVDGVEVRAASVEAARPVAVAANAGAHQEGGVGRARHPDPVRLTCAGRGSADQGRHGPRSTRPR